RRDAIQAFFVRPGLHLDAGFDVDHADPGIGNDCAAGILNGAGNRAVAALPECERGGEQEERKGQSSHTLSTIGYLIRLVKPEMCRNRAAQRRQGSRAPDSIPHLPSPIPQLIQLGMLRRTFLQTLPVAATALSAAPADEVPVKLGFDSYSLRAFKWKGVQLLDFAASQKLDTIQFSSLDDYGGLDPANLQKVKDRAAQLNIALDSGMGCICETSKSWKKGAR